MFYSCTSLICCDMGYTIRPAGGVVHNVCAQHCHDGPHSKRGAALGTKGVGTSAVPVCLQRPYRHDAVKQAAQFDEESRVWENARYTGRIRAAGVRLGIDQTDGCGDKQLCVGACNGYFVWTVNVQRRYVHADAVIAHTPGKLGLNVLEHALRQTFG